MMTNEGEPLRLIYCPKCEDYFVTPELQPNPDAEEIKYYCDNCSNRFKDAIADYTDGEGIFWTYTPEWTNENE